MKDVKTFSLATFITFAIRFRGYDGADIHDCMVFAFILYVN